MKLYYSPGACSLAVHIAAREAGCELQLVKVDLRTHTLTAGGADYYAINPRGYVPLLELADGSRHTEAAALLQYMGDQDGSGRLLPAPGSLARLQVLEWLAYISTELHKGLGPLWRPDTPAAMRLIIGKNLQRRFAELEARLQQSSYLAADHFTVADAYAFTVLGWTRSLKISLHDYPRLEAYLARIAERPHVQAALRAEGLLPA